MDNGIILGLLLYQIKLVSLGWIRICLKESICWHGTYNDVMKLVYFLLFTLAEVTRVLFTFGLCHSGLIIYRSRHNQTQLVSWISSWSCLALVVPFVSS